MLTLGNKNALSLSDFSVIENKIFIGIADKDSMVSLEETTAVFRQLKNGAMYMLPNTKHPIETVDSKLLVELVNRFC